MTETTSHPDDPKAAETALYALFAEHGIPWTHTDHPPLHTVEESKRLRGDIPGAHVKNMFLKGKRDALVLVTCLEHRRIRIRDLERAIGVRGCSFASPEVLWDVLGVRPGAVTPFAAVNDRERRATVVLDAQMLAAAEIAAHPLHNAATATISSRDLIKFFTVTGHNPIKVDFDTLEALAAART